MKGSLRIGNTEVIDAVWFEFENYRIGIIVCHDIITGKIESFIGRGKGENEADDCIKIMQNGAPYPVDSALALFGDELTLKEKICDAEIIDCYLKLMTKCKKQIIKYKGI